MNRKFNCKCGHAVIPIIVIVVLAITSAYLFLQLQEVQKENKVLGGMVVNLSSSSYLNFNCSNDLASPTPTAQPFDACTQIKDTLPAFKYYCKGELFTAFAQSSAPYSGEMRYIDAANYSLLAAQQPVIYANLSPTVFPLVEVRLTSSSQPFGLIIVLDGNGAILKEVPLQLMRLQ